MELRDAHPSRTDLPPQTLPWTPLLPRLSLKLAVPVTTQSNHLMQRVTISTMLTSMRFRGNQESSSQTKPYTTHQWPGTLLMDMPLTKLCFSFISNRPCRKWAILMSNLVLKVKSVKIVAFLTKHIQYAKMH